MKLDKYFHGIYSDYPGVGKVYDEDVYKFIKKHSRLIDRLNPAKMTAMALNAQIIIFGCVDIDPDGDWKFWSGKDPYCGNPRNYKGEDEDESS